MITIIKKQITAKKYIDFNEDDFGDDLSNLDLSNHKFR